MKKESIIIRGIINGLATFAYISLLVFFMSHGERFFEEVPELLIGMTMLTLFVFSALVTASLMLGKPVLLYLQDQKKEAIQMIIVSTSTLFAIIVSLLFIGRNFFS